MPPHERCGTGQNPRPSKPGSTSIHVDGLPATTAPAATCRWRQFNGRAASAGLEVSARQEGRSGNVKLVVTNRGTATTRLTVSDAYGKDHPKSHALKPGARFTTSVNTRHAGNWYDLSVTSDQDSGFLRRLCGHVETGRASTSDPAIIAG
ncbi:phospholipase domain-containing protein [Nonomuraea sp. B12E4]|uniref:phospholipase domain-containing protein n=1 Tax=Nonomuraea sp. B12E4 TaxID=3153564 RepID=UPI00325E4E20